MSVVINSNLPALIAANNLAATNRQLNRSLNQLSSGSRLVNASDDAGGQGVALKLSSVANRDSQIEANLADAGSFAQTQDGALQVVAGVLNRISELAALYTDPTKNSSDLADYDDEFSQLQSELTALGGQTFNGVSLFGSASLTADATEDLSASGAVTVSQQDLLATGGFATLSETWADLSGWTAAHSNAGNPMTVSVTAGSLQLSGDGTAAGEATATSNASFSGPFRIATTFNVGGTNGDLSVNYGATTLADLSTFVYSGTHTLQIDVDSSGQSTVSVDGSAVPGQARSGVSTSSPQPIVLEADTAGAITATVGPLTVSSLATGSNTHQVTAASSLAGLSLATITGAIQDVAAMRATNGAEQSRINFASSLLTTNRTNLEATVSRISDVDVAQVSTALARYQVLVQAGVSMLTQANQSAQVALKLITGG